MFVQSEHPLLYPVATTILVFFIPDARFHPCFAGLITGPGNMPLPFEIWFFGFQRYGLQPSSWSLPLAIRKCGIQWYETAFHYIRNRDFPFANGNPEPESTVGNTKESFPMVIQWKPKTYHTIAEQEKEKPMVILMFNLGSSHVHGPVYGLMHRCFCTGFRRRAPRQKGRAPPGMCKALHRQSTADEQSRRKRCYVWLDDRH